MGTFLGFWWLVLVVGTNGLRTQHRRKLQSGDFVPLSCNNNIGACQSWSSRFGTGTTYSSRIIVDCGECVTIDHPESAIELQDGIDIRGRLVFPDNYSIEVTTPMVVVQGELEIIATKPVDGAPSIRFNFVGTNDSQTFEAVADNAGICTSCLAGRKAFVVAGGSLNIHGLPTSTPTWVPLFDVSGGSFESPTNLIVEDTVDGKWAAGAEVLITSHTRVWNDHQVRTISAVEPAPGQPGFVLIQLDSAILRPTTYSEYPDFATEVALLSRNIQWDGGVADAVGGHFEVRQTPSVMQTIEGVDIVGFGQPGTLGRYPVHFHLCGDISGSYVSKNTIRQSKQRCIALHGTDNTLVAENIAFDTQGHCFLTEDGIEIGNTFLRNLGAQTSNQVTLIPGEDDDEAATFWITSVQNSYIGNIAAGSQDSGFWFAPHKRGPRAYLYPDLDPLKEIMTEFRDNVIHSCDGRAGAIRTYRPGYHPRSTVTLSGTRSFRNSARGIVLHRVHNVIVSNSIFADNDNSIDIDRADDITVENTVIIGESDSFKDLQARQNTESVCRQNRVMGIDLHTWKIFKENGGATIRNVTLSGFSDNACPNPSAIWFDTFTLRQGMFELYTSFEETTVVDGPDLINFCHVLNNGTPPIDKLYLIDLDGGLSGGQSVVPPATLIGTSPEMSRFVDPSKCTAVPTGCYDYCSDTCFRSVRYELEGDGTENYKVKICGKGVNDNCAIFPGSRRGQENRLFTVHVPTGFEYNAVFLDENESEVAVTLEDSQYEVDLCSGALFVVDLVDSLAEASTEESPAPVTPSPTGFPTSAPVTKSPTASPTVLPPANPAGSDFTYLSCNENYRPCESWSATFGTDTVHPSRVIIDCGTCITMDLSAPAIELQDGIDIRGKLVFPDNYSLEIFTSTIVVQGDLEMHSSKAVDGIPNVKITLTGDDDALYFTPVQENRNLCSPAEICQLFMKSIVVAGGKLDLHGLPANTPTWVLLYDVAGADVNNPTSIIVEDSVNGKWAPGAKLLITSHTRVWNEQQVRTIANVSPGDPGYVQIDLDSSILRPTTLKEHPDFAVEIALLSRNIVFDGGAADTNGGYLQIRQTSSVTQTIDGVEITNFGQPGIQGRYPIHFRLCGDVSGTSISRNAVTHSKQRCVVLQATDGALIKENVAYDTLGMCYMTEDGVETNNSFMRNLAAQTADQSTVIAGEKDGDASSFFVTNVLNTFVGNRVAGSQGSGYWFSALKRGPRANQFPDLSPVNEVLTEFRDNVVHSTGPNAGALRTFQPGYSPTEIATIAGLKAYRNNNVGLNIYKAQNLLIRDSLFADNNVGIDIGRSEKITIMDTTFIGESTSYLELAGRQNVQAVCRSNRVVGLDLHTWKNNIDFDGVTIENTVFSGFSNTQCIGPSAIWMDKFTLRQGQFELFASFRNTTLSDGPSSIDFCFAESGGINTIYLVDVDGSLSDGAVSAPGTLIGNSPEMSRFVDVSRCSLVSGSCYSYCHGTCFRSVRYGIDASGTENYKLKVCRSGESNGCAEFSGSLRGNEPRYFVAHLPTGIEYMAAFVDENGAEVSPVPTLVSSGYEADLCSGATFVVDLVDILSSPPTAHPSPSPSSSPTESVCSGNLISNADMEDGFSGSWTGTGTLANVAGYNSATAVSYTGALWTINGPSHIGNVLDACLTVGSSWDVSVHVKLNNPWFGDGERCATDATCPSLRIVITDSNANEIVSLQSRNYASSWNASGFNQLQAVLAMPTAGWDGTIGTVSISFDEYHAENGLVIDDLFIVPAQV